MARVRIVKVPKALSGLEVKMQPGLYGTNGNNQFNKSAHLEAGKISQRPTEVRSSLTAVPREKANLEAEGGETAVVNIDGIPAHFKISGPRHTNGGVPLNLPDNSFIFSDTAKMKIKDPNILAQFGMKPKRGGYTPAEISKKYDINRYRKTLADPNSEDLDRKTAEMMIANYNEKLAKLALAQESIKGFPQGIPVIAMPYIDSMEIDPSTFVPDQAQEQLEEGSSPDADMGTSRYGSQVISQWNTKKYGGLPTAQYGKMYSTTGANLEKNLQPQLPGGFLGVGKGFSNDPQEELKWRNDPDVGIRYQKYAEALRSGDPAKMRALAEEFSDDDISGSLGWWPGTKQNKLRDFSAILKQEAYKIDKSKKEKEPNEQEIDLNARKDAYDTYNKVYMLLQRAKQKGDVDTQYNLTKELEGLGYLHPEFKQKNIHRRNIYTATGFRQPESDSMEGAILSKFMPPDTSLYYTDKEKEKIATLKNKYSTEGILKGDIGKKLYAEEIAAATKKAQEKAKGSTPKKSVDTYFPSDEELLKMSDEEVAKWDAIYAKTHPTPKKKEGGQLDKYKGEDKGSQVPQNETPSQRRARLLKEGKTSTGNKSSISAIKLTPEEEEIRRKHAETTPEKYVSDEDYETLKQAYIKAARSSGAEVDDEGNIIKMGDVNKKTKETEEFQKLYHKLLPDEARRIIASEKDPTTKGKGLGHGEKYDLAANEDQMFGKRTRQYWQAVKKKPADKPADVKTQTKTTAPADRGPIERRPPIDLGKKAYAPWWLQDIVKTAGAAADLARVKRYLPWQATPETRLPDATFYDPTRELAANAEQANIQTQGMAAFTGPQALSARSSQIQGKALENAANIMSKYNNMNVQLANQLSQERTGIMNQAAMNRANLDTQLFDKYTIANQQFDNAKNMARQNLRQSYIDAITNRAKTQALNTLYPNFYTDPITGGFVNKTGYANIRPTAPGSTEADEVEKLIKRFPGLTPDKAYDIIRKNKGTSDDSGDASGYLKAQGYT